MKEHRIVALVPSATEIVARLGFENQLVGRSHGCDYPPSVERVPVCSEPRIDVNGTSREIDERVKIALRDEHSIDGRQYFNRPGPRLVESAEILAELLHPGEFDFGHEGTGWQRL